MSKTEPSSLKRNFEWGSTSGDASSSIGINVEAESKRIKIESPSEDTAKDFGAKKDMEVADIVKENSLRFVPAKSLIKFRSVSKEWDQWITNPFLAHQQSYSFRKMSGYFCQSTTGYTTSFITLSESSSGVPSPSLSFLPALQINSIGSCNGLLLCRGNDDYYICNPVTERWKQLPPPGYYHGENPSPVLAFEPSILNMGAHYHVVCAVPLFDSPTVYFEIYSSETNSWTVSSACCVELENTGLKDNGFYANGVVYWETFQKEILAFDLKNEVYGVVSLPNDIAHNGILNVIRGDLCYVCARFVSFCRFEVDVYGGLNLDRRMRTVGFDVGTSSDYVKILPRIDGDDEVVMVLAGGIMLSCNLKDGKVEKVRTDGRLDSRDKHIPYVNSLVSVD